MNYRWCLSRDWRTPAEGEAWRESRSHKQAARAIYDEVARRGIPHNPYVRAVEIESGRTVLDFGSHTLFGVIQKDMKEAK